MKARIKKGIAAGTKKKIALCFAVAAVIVGVAIPQTQLMRVEETGESLQAIYDTVMERALQCYVIEGAYPVSLEYLEENYGLTVNTEEYKIVYTPYAENLPPDVRVIYRGK